MAARLFVALFSLLAGLASATPFTPTSADQILTRLSPAEQAMGKAGSPQTEADALELARQYIDHARNNEDSRFLGYARATLSAWSTPPTSAPVALLMAEIEQRQHQFESARQRLSALLEQRPDAGQAWLMLADLHRVQGRFAEARKACRNSAVSLPPTSVVICQSSIQAMTGKLPAAWQTLSRLADSALPLSANEQQWLHTLLAEMAIQQGRHDEAQHHLELALQQAPRSPYLQYLQADLWLAQGYNDKVITQLQGWNDRDNALLRLAIAGQRSGHPDASQWRRAYQDRLAAAQQSGRDIHLREQARFQLQVSAQEQEALTNATANWSKQRELSDLRLLLASAVANQDEERYRQAEDFIQRHGITDAPSQQLLDQRQ